MLRRFTGVAISDFGCAFSFSSQCRRARASRDRKQKFTKALVLSGSLRVEVDVNHAARARLELLAAAPAPARAARARGLLAAADPVDRDRARRHLPLATRLGICRIWYWIDRSNFQGRCWAAWPSSSCSGSRASSSRSWGSAGRIQREVEGRPLLRRGAVSKRVLVTGGPASSRRTSSATCWRTPFLESSRSTPSPTRETWRTSPT